MPWFQVGQLVCPFTFHVLKRMFNCSLSVLKGIHPWNYVIMCSLIFPRRIKQKEVKKEVTMLFSQAAKTKKEVNK